MRGIKMFLSYYCCPHESHILKSVILVLRHYPQARAFIHVETITGILANLISKKADPGMYNVVTHNLQILELVDVLKNIFPELEFIFVNQHLNLRGIRIQPNKDFISKLGAAKPGNLEDDLKAFVNKLPFGSGI
jgi:UDP-glucose 4-epimerase